MPEKEKKKKRSFEKSKITRKKIIDTAYEFFLELGFADTTVAMVSKKMGVSYGTVYTYFNSKSQILIEIMEDVVGHLYMMAREPFFPKTAKEAYSTIRRQSLSYLQFSVTHKEILRIIEEAINLSPEVRDKWEGIRNYFFSTITQDISYSQSIGLLRDGVVPEISSRAWHSTNEFFLWENLKNPHQYNLENVVTLIAREYVMSIYKVGNYDELK